MRAGLATDEAGGEDRLVDVVTPNEIAKTLGITGLDFRNWLRSQKASGHPLLAGHEHNARWEFSPADATQLTAEYRAGQGRPSASPVGRVPSQRTEPRTSRGGARPSSASAVLGSADVLPSSAPGHRVTETWMGEEVVTLADLLRPGVHAVVVGINPSPVSVARGHYYQGIVGQRFFKRLAQAGLVVPDAAGFEDDAAYASGIGFTDVVKRPTPRAHDLRPGELEHGRELLEAKLSDLGAKRIIFTFKGSAQVLLGRFEGHGRLDGVTLAGAEVFVMPGPMERVDRVQAALNELRAWWR